MKLIRNHFKNSITVKAAHLIVNGNTIRQAADVLRVSKSTVHYHLKNKLNEIDPKLYLRVLDQLNYHKSIKHIRGGQSTKRLHAEKNKMISGG